MQILNSVSKDNKIKSVSFSGYATEKNAKGEDVYTFNYPSNTGKYKAYVEVFSLSKDENGNYNIKEQLSGTNHGKMFPLDKTGTSINMQKEYGIEQTTPFAYRYKLMSKDTAIETVDSGNVIRYPDNTAFNVVLQNGTKTNKGGSMKLIIPDTYKPGFVIKDSSVDEKSAEFISKDAVIEKNAKDFQRTFANKAGGTMAGIIEDLPNMAKVGYTRIVSLPLFTDDSLSAHGYWNKNAMQIIQSAGNVNDYASLQRNMFANGMNLVADGAFVNEGLEGIHFKDVLKWGEDSPFFGWFRAENIKNSPLSMGVFSKNHEFIRHRIVNAPFSYSQNSDGQVKIEKSKHYNPGKPTYMQIYDERLVGKDNLADSSKLIKLYDKTTSDNLFEINNHNDTVVNYSFEVEPETYNKNIRDLNLYNKSHSDKISMNSSDGAMFLTKAKNYKLDEKFESGVETWDANSDITKLNYIVSKSDILAMKKLSPEEKANHLKTLMQNNYQVQDYAISSGKFWTNKTKNIINEYAAQELGEIPANCFAFNQKIDGLIEDGKLPQSLSHKVTKDLFKNVLNGDYKLSIAQKSKDYHENVLEGVMNLPLDSIEFGDSISSVMAYPYITNRATSAETLGKSRFDLFKAGNPHLLDKYKNVYEKMTNVYTKTLSNFADGIFSHINSAQPEKAKLINGKNATELGQYVLSTFGEDIAKFAVVMALCPKAIAKMKLNGELVYDYKALKNLHLGDIGVGGATPEELSSNLVSAINSGIKNISAEKISLLEKSLSTRLKGVTADSYKFAEVLADKASAGLDWRIDATKDIADMDSIRNYHSDFANVWKDLTGFWTNFNSKILQTNPNSYIASEMTQVYSLHDMSNTKPAKNLMKGDCYPNGDVASDKLVKDSGMTTTANYSTFFANIIGIFGRSFEEGRFDSSYRNRERVVFDKLNNGYLDNEQMKSLLYSYTFVGNHDKPRALHCLALDMKDFHTDFSKSKDLGQKQNAISILKNLNKENISENDVNNFNFGTVSGKAIAMGGCLKTRMGMAIDEIVKDSTENAELKNKLGNAIANLSSGKFKGKEFSPDAFGTKPFDQTIDCVLQEIEFENAGKPLDSELKTKIYDKTFENTIKPAMSKLEGMMSYLVSLPGNPTLFAGDELGLTGYDEKCKNVYLQSRGCLHWDWLSGSNKEFFQGIQKKLNDIMALRGKKELEPLNSGAPFLLPMQKVVENGVVKNEIPAVLRQGNDGSMVVSLFNSTGVGESYYNEAIPENLSIDKIKLSDFGFDKGIQAGLTSGKIFKNAKNPKDLYKVSEDGYSIEKLDGGKINVSERNLILYSEPENKENLAQTVFKPSFLGRKVLYNPQFNFVSNPYSVREQKDCGKHLSLMSK